MKLTRAQAEARARGLYGARAGWADGPTEKQAAELARQTFEKWLDGLALMVRAPEIVTRHPDIARNVARLLYPVEFATGPYRVGTGHHIPGLGFSREIRGTGWSFAEACLEAEKREGADPK